MGGYADAAVDAASWLTRWLIALASFCENVLVDQDKTIIHMYLNCDSDENS